METTKEDVFIAVPDVVDRNSAILIKYVLGPRQAVYTACDAAVAECGARPVHASRGAAAPPPGSLEGDAFHK